MQKLLTNPGRNLLNTPHGFYFRMKVPKRHREHFQRREFKRALHTTDAIDAQKKAMLLAAMVDEYIARLDVVKGFRMSKLPFFTGMKLAEVEVTLDGIKLRGVETDPLHAEIENKAVREVVESARKEYQTLLDSHGSPQIAQAFAELSKPEVNSQPDAPITPTAAPKKLFAELIDDFTGEKTVSGDWDSESSNGRKEQLLRGLEHFGDCDLATITRDDARKFMDILTKLPPNLKKNRAFSNMTLASIAAKNQHGKTISAKSVNMAITDIASFFKWCIGCEYITKNPFAGLSVKEPNLALTQRLPYTQPELSQLFLDKMYQFHRCEPSEFFLPLLGLYHGARLNELCQLHTSDIRQIEDIWVIDINENDAQKSIKTKDSRRILPIHPELIRLNFIKYVEHLKPGRVFPNLPYKKGKFSGDYSKRFGTVRRRVGIVDKDYYSFRHLVSAELERFGIPEHLVASILGHKHPQITFGRYGEPKHIKRIHKIISRLKFNINVPPWPEQKIARSRALSKIRETDPTLKASDESLDEILKLGGKVKRQI